MSERGESRVEVPHAVVAATQRHLRSKGAIGHEGVVLWRGTTRPLAVIEAIVPAQQTSGSHFSVPLAERQRIARMLAGSGESILVQVHSHPCSAYHSPTDDRHALPRRVGALSLVIPDYCARRDLLDEAVLFELHAGGSWKEVPLELLDLRGSSPSNRRRAE